MSAAERLNQILSHLKMSANRFSVKLGMKQNTRIYHVKNGRNEFSEDLARLISSKFPELNYSWILTGEGEMLNYKEEPRFSKTKLEVQKIHSPSYKETFTEDEIPVYDLDAAANLKTLFETKQPDVLDTLRIPNLPKCDGALYVRGDSMYPLLKSGDLIAYKQVQGLDYLIYGEMYLIDFSINGDDFLSVKYVNRSEKENHIKLVSYNTYHEPMDIPMESIRAIAIIKASVRINTMM